MLKELKGKDFIILKKPVSVTTHYVPLKFEHYKLKIEISIDWVIVISIELGTRGVLHL